MHQCMMYNPSKTDGITVVPSIALRLSWLHILFGLLYALLLSITISLRGPVHWVNNIIQCFFILIISQSTEKNIN